MPTCPYASVLPQCGVARHRGLVSGRTLVARLVTSLLTAKGLLSERGSVESAPCLRDIVAYGAHVLARPLEGGRSVPCVLGCLPPRHYSPPACASKPHDHTLLPGAAPSPLPAASCTCTPLGQVCHLPFCCPLGGQACRALHHARQSLERCGAPPGPCPAHLQERVPGASWCHSC